MIDESTFLNDTWSSIHIFKKMAHFCQFQFAIRNNIIGNINWHFLPIFFTKFS